MMKWYGIGLAIALIGIPACLFGVFACTMVAFGAIFGMIGHCVETAVRSSVRFAFKRLRNKQPHCNYATNDDDRY